MSTLGSRGAFWETSHCVQSPFCLLPLSPTAFNKACLFRCAIFFFFFLPRCPAPLLYVFSAWFLTVGSCCCKMAFSTSALPLCETVQNVPIPEHGWTLLFDLIKNVCLNLFRYLTCSTSKQLQLHLAFMISSTSLKSTISLSYQK